MSVQTTADEALGKAEEHVQQAVLAMKEIVVDRCYGSDEFSEDYRRRLR